MRRQHRTGTVRLWSILFVSLTVLGSYGGTCDSVPLPSTSDTLGDDPIDHISQTSPTDTSQAVTPADSGSTADPTSDQVLGYTPPAPVTSASSKPTNLIAVASPDQIVLTWKDNAVSETGFVVQRNVNRAGWLNYGFTLADSTTFTDTDVQPAVKYCYRVIATDGVNNSSASTQSCVTIPPDDSTASTDDSSSQNNSGTSSEPKPSAPSSLVVTNVNGQVQLTWIDTSNNETGFEVWRYTTSWSSYASVGAGVTGYLDAQVEPGTNYCYRVRAFNASGASSYCSLKCMSLPSAADSTDPACPDGNCPGDTSGGTTDVPTTPASAPAAPSGLVLSVVDGKIQLAWTNASDNETAFEVWRFIGTWALFATLPPDVTNFVDSQVEASNSYCYRVRAVNAAGASGYCPLKCATAAASTTTTDPNCPDGNCPPVDPTETTGPSYYVAPGGSTANDGSSAHPWPSVEYALSKVGGGNRIILKAGNYNSIRLEHIYSGTPDQPTVIRSETKWAAVIVGPFTHGVFSPEDDAALPLHDVVIDGFQIDGGNYHNITYNGARFVLDKRIVVRNCWIHHCAASGVAMHSCTDSTVEMCLIETNGLPPQVGATAQSHGVYADGSGLTIQSNVLRANGGWGLHLYSDIRDSLIANNVVFDHPNGSGILIQSAQGTGHNRVVNNTVVRNLHGLSLSSGTGQVAANNILVDNTFTLLMPSGTINSTFDRNLCKPAPSSNPALVFTPPGAHNIYAEPGFVNSNGGIFYLQSSSPAVQAGDALECPAVDFWGRVRSTTAVDLGAFSYQSSLAGVINGPVLDWWILP